MPTRFTTEKIAAAIEALSQLRDQQVTLARSWAPELELVPPYFRPSALNLLHYLALRQLDLWPLQRDLSSLGLSSLGRTERTHWRASMPCWPPCTSWRLGPWNVPTASSCRWTSSPGLRR